MVFKTLLPSFLADSCKFLASEVLEADEQMEIKTKSKSAAPEDRMTVRYVITRYMPDESEVENFQTKTVMKPDGNQFLLQKRLIIPNGM